MKFINFSRSSSPSEIRVGCPLGNLCLDVSDAIENDVLKFPGSVSRIEDVLAVESGLEILENQLRTLLPEFSISSNGTPAIPFR